MKTTTNYFVLVVVTLAVTVPTAQGLECYRCISGDGLSDAPMYHKKCKEGKLPGSHVETCTDRNVLDSQTRQPYNASFLEALSKQGYPPVSCYKYTSNIYGVEWSEKFCSYMPNADRVDYCEYGFETECYCHGNKCNSAVSASFQTFILFIAVFSALVF